MIASMIVVGGAPWDGTTYSVPRPHLWWIPTAVAAATSVTVLTRPTRPTLRQLRASADRSWRRLGRNITGAVIFGFAGCAGLAWMFSGVPAVALDGAVSTFAERHDLDAEHLRGAAWGFTPRQGEKCIAKVHHHQRQLNISGDCVEGLLDDPS